MSARSVDLNLLPKEVWEKGILGQVLHWALSVGRYVVVFTELIVIGAFLYRFGLDRKLTELNASIKTKQEIINSFGDLEASFRLVQSQLETVKKVSGEPKSLRSLQTLSQIMPTDAVLTNVIINAEEIVIEGFVASQTGLATLLNQAQNLPEFTDVILENVQSSTDEKNSIDFKLVLNFKTT